MRDQAGCHSESFQSLNRKIHYSMSSLHSIPPTQMSVSMPNSQYLGTCKVVSSTLQLSYLTIIVHILIFLMPSAHKVVLLCLLSSSIHLPRPISKLHLHFMSLAFLCSSQPLVILNLCLWIPQDFICSSYFLESSCGVNGSFVFVGVILKTKPMICFSNIRGRRFSGDAEDVIVTAHFEMYVTRSEVARSKLAALRYVSLYFPNERDLLNHRTLPSRATYLEQGSNK